MNTCVLWRIFAILLLTVILAGCSTAPPQPILAKPLVHHTADLTISLRFLNEETLVQRHGRNDSRLYTNPYYGYPGLITKKKLIVFEFQATSIESSVAFALEDMELLIGRVVGNAKSRPYLSRIWGHNSRAAVDGMDHTMKKTILPRDFEVTPDNPVSGYLVFGENYPEEGGDALITMYVSTQSGDEGTIEIPLEFSADGLVKKSRENTGIFDE